MFSIEKLKKLLLDDVQGGSFSIPQKHGMGAWYLHWTHDGSGWQNAPKLMPKY